MNIDIIISADYINEDSIKDKVVVVIDMLRATSVITTAFINGCKELIPYLTVEEAMEKSKEFKAGDCILGGERKAVKIEGFDLSNSPLEYTEEVVKDKTVIITTTNGTRSLTKCKSAKRVFVGAMINGKAVAEKLVEIGEDVVIVNAGTNGQFSMDDFICAGYMINEMLKISNKLELTDIAKTANYIYENNKGIDSFINSARHYGVMKELGLMNDVKYAMKKEITNIVPEYKNGHIVK
ncbi:2-phosphosulfolactate phosphatase [Clostridium moniliforme]|uniref:Probable 2-phosphosulfolactate phosphatase n=1 Tax=Clostridium moniliforme TaxID=39489 RepID=A0ABS4F1V7_9CLOT|nr:2-phosphosulfolactate phosphatase family protein [Clostridium moniliforme]MBP1890233.1 2-phosphosulfolactate phosphatase [Clostridium moniliforme]